ncbi:hypothetical protein FE257_005257 [Aspergillus nanangensis]|uniref:NAD(P)-binding protein n=1 Tax=Aspergillus nanangensis TaxID=2582783 RepID=A0AAD4CQU0_ASPNN|nr:hypothetical protein FE257_005257 [Aspergillus nanangensis]
MTVPKIVLITGGNTGIGYETVKALLESDQAYRIFVGSRSSEKGNLAIEGLTKEHPKTTSSLELLEVDVSTDESIQQAFEHVKAKTDHIDILINNAGAAFDPLYLDGGISLRDCFNNAYNVNVTGAHIMTYTFMPLLLKSTSPRLIFVTGLSHMTIASQKYFPTPPQPAGWPKEFDFDPIGYRCSKTALNMLILDWSHKLKADGVKVFGAGPGFLATGLGGKPGLAEKMGAKHPSIGGQFLRTVVEGERDEDVGRLVEKGGITPF